MKWEEALIRICYKVIPTGGEVRIQFSERTKGKKQVVVPIIRFYPNNQLICEEVEIIED